MAGAETFGNNFVARAFRGQETFETIVIAVPGFTWNYFTIPERAFAAHFGRAIFSEPHSCQSP